MRDRPVRATLRERGRAEASAQGKPTVLIVDDEPSIRLLVRATLEAAGYDVLEAVDGPSAIQAVRETLPDLVLLDLLLPRISGIDVCRSLSADPRTAGVPVVLLTGLLQPDERGAAAEAGAQGFVSKPFAPSYLLAQIGNHLRASPTIGGQKPCTTPR